MEKLFIPASNSTPMISINYALGTLEISGHSSPEDAQEFYEPVLDSIRYLGQSPLSKIKVNFSLLSFDTSTARSIFSILKELREVQRDYIDVEICWNYEDGDDEILESGKDFQEIIEIPFHFKVLELLS